MSFPTEFNQDGKVFIIVYANGQNGITGEYLGWSMSFYSTEKGRKRGLSYLQELGHYTTFILTLDIREVLEKAVNIPFIPREKRYKSRRF